MRASTKTKATARKITKIAMAALGLLLWLCLVHGQARAQSTGSSMGGGSWGSSGGSSWSGSSGGSSWGSSSSSWGSGGSSGGFFSSSDDSSGGGGCENMSGGEFAVLMFFVIVLVIGYGVFKLYLTNDSPNYAQAYSYIPPTPKVDVSVLRLAIDWNERAWVQSELARIAKSTDLSTNKGLLSMLREVAMTLRRTKDSWLYAGIVDAVPMNKRRAEGFFTKQAMDARSRYKDELLRTSDASGTTTRDAPDHLIAGYDEGEGLVVITIVMAAKGTLNDFGTMKSTENVRAWFEGLNYVTSGELVACEVIWSPAAENDRLSSLELETLYPEMHKLHHATLAGRVQCEYCHAHFPAELVTCPHCGGKVKTELTA